MKIKVKKLCDDAILPKYATAGANCFDLHVCGLKTPVQVTDAYSFRTGLAFEIPDGHVMLVFSRSGHGFKYDTMLANAVGVVDSDYVGETHVRLSRNANVFEPLTVKNGDRIAQAMIIKAPQVELEWADELKTTERGTNGRGSTGS